jgi:hypothetical protein
MLKSELLRVLQQEIRKHDFDCFVDKPPSMPQGGRGVVVPGFPGCRKQFQTMNQFIEHLAQDVLPKVMDALSSLRES